MVNNNVWVVLNFKGMFKPALELRNEDFVSEEYVEMDLIFGDSDECQEFIDGQLLGAHGSS